MKISMVDAVPTHEARHPGMDCRDPEHRDVIECSYGKPTLTKHVFKTNIRSKLQAV